VLSAMPTSSRVCSQTSRALRASETLLWLLRVRFSRSLQWYFMGVEGLSV